MNTSLGLIGWRRFLGFAAKSFAGMTLLLVLAIGSASAGPIVTTHNGMLQGIVVNGLNEYLGVPYAKAPVGKLRWVPTQSFGKWSGVMNATAFGNVCPQFNSLVGGVIGDENCLFLNVYAPSSSNSKSLLPVMVWIHGGGLISGASSFYDPTPLVQQGIIVVTINYRLGLLGFFAQTALDVPNRRVGNYGFIDQQFALKWIKMNIAAFGGNPKRMTIFGESAGGQSVYSQLASPLAAGLFQGAIAESGAYSSFTDYTDAIIPLAQAETLGSIFEISGAQFATNVGCASQTAACLRAVPAATLVSAQPPIAMYPFVDGRLLTETPAAAFASGNFNQVPVISGTNHDEYRLFVADGYDYQGNPLTNAEYTTAVDALWGVLAPFVLPVYPLPANPPADAASLALGASGTDGLFSCPARDADQSLSQFVTTYTYEFSDENAPLYFGLVPASFPLGAYHSAEIQYLMNIVGIPAPFTPDQQTLSATMIGYWTQFAATGDPNFAGAPTWTPYNSTTDEYQSFVPPTPVVDTTFAGDHLCTTFWDFL